jgi:hypothetical protein
MVLSSSRFARLASLPVWRPHCGSRIYGYPREKAVEVGRAGDSLKGSASAPGKPSVRPTVPRLGLRSRPQR